ncbi:MAG: hypothetical protein MZV63_34955 [Marinilabiliales bacterium]|nr:hypothetical protein [Marinilabiliales bacterium]
MSDKSITLLDHRTRLEADKPDRGDGRAQSTSGIRAQGAGLQGTKALPQQALSAVPASVNTLVDREQSGVLRSSCVSRVTSTCDALLLAGHNSTM